MAAFVVKSTKSCGWYSAKNVISCLFVLTNLHVWGLPMYVVSTEFNLYFFTYKTIYILIELLERWTVWLVNALCNPVDGDHVPYADWQPRWRIKKGRRATSVSAKKICTSYFPPTLRLWNRKQFTKEKSRYCCYRLAAVFFSSIYFTSLPASKWRNEAQKNDAMWCRGWTKLSGPRFRSIFTPKTLPYKSLPCRESAPGSAVTPAAVPWLLTAPRTSCGVKS